MKAILAGILSGVFTSLAGVWVFSMLFHLDKKIYATLLPKSITTAIGMGISEELGGIVTITVAAIIITGIIGNMFGDVICRLCGIRHPIATGLAMGTAKAMEIGEIEGAMSSLSIAVAGLMTVIGATIFYQLY
jgi:putative effector of murein hydrolase